MGSAKNRTPEEAPTPESTALASGRQADEEIERGQWSGKFDFLMSMIAYAVGLGNWMADMDVRRKEERGSKSDFFERINRPFSLFKVNLFDFFKNGYE